MSDKFFIIVHNSDWHISPAEFLERFKARWPDATATTIQDPADHCAFDIVIPRAEYTQTGSFTRDGKAVILDYTKMEDCIEVVLWFRSIVPSQHELVFLEESGAYYTEIKPGVTETDMRVLMK